MAMTEGKERLFVSNGSAMYEQVVDSEWMVMSTRAQGNVASGVYHLSDAQPAKTTGPGARYEGTIVHHDKRGNVYQSVDEGVLVKHEKSAFGRSELPAIGSVPKIQYLRGQALVEGRERGLER
jgi:hypothetical protein